MELIGRDAPLALLRAKLEQAVAGRGGIATLTGEPGIGTSLPESSAGDHLDAKARRAYEARLRDLEARLSEAASHADVGRREKLRRERAMLEAELARAFGLGNRPRQAGSAGERARVNVQCHLPQPRELQRAGGLLGRRVAQARRDARRTRRR